MWIFVRNGFYGRGGRLNFRIAAPVPTSRPISTSNLGQNAAEVGPKPGTTTQSKAKRTRFSSSSLRAGDRRFDPGHVHHILKHLRQAWVSWCDRDVATFCSTF